VPLSVRGIIVYCLSVLMVGCIFFTGFTLLYDRLTVTTTEAILRKENDVMDKHQILLTSQLQEVENTLTDLKSRDESLYQKLFEETSSSEKKSKHGKRNILLADASEFTEMLKEVDDHSDRLYHQSSASNTKFNRLFITKEDVKILNALPTLQPITNTNLDLLVSGFGVRINPFHK
jgi:hypothetical protein